MYRTGVIVLVTVDRRALLAERARDLCGTAVATVPVIVVVDNGAIEDLLPACPHATLGGDGLVRRLETQGIDCRTLGGEAPAHLPRNIPEGACVRLGGDIL